MESKEFNKQLSGGNNGFLHLVLNLALLVFFIWIVVRFAKFDCMKDADRPQRIKTHEEVLRERAEMETYQRMSESERIAACGNALAMGILALMFADPEAMKRRTEEMKAMQPYLDEIHETDKRYRNEEIHLSGFEW